MYLMRTHKITSNRIFGQTNGLGTAISNWLNHYFSSNNCCLLSAAYAWLLYVMKNTYHELFRDFDFVSSFSLLCRVFGGKEKGGRHFAAHAIFFPFQKCCAFYLARHDSLSTHSHALSPFRTGLKWVFLLISIYLVVASNACVCCFSIQRCCFAMQCSILHTLRADDFLFIVTQHRRNQNKYFSIVLASTVVLNYSVAPQFHMHTRKHAANHQ